MQEREMQGNTADNCPHLQLGADYWTSSLDV